MLSSHRRWVNSCFGTLLVLLVKADKQRLNVVGESL